MPLPDWVLKFKTKGIAIEQRGGRYYASRIHSVYDPVKKRDRKVTDEYLGTVTPQGIVPPKHKRPHVVSSVLETGNILYLERFTESVVGPLRELWPESWQSILAASVLKLAYRMPLKRLQALHESSYASRLWPDAHLSKNSLTDLLRRLGREWDSQRTFFETVSKASSNMAIDLTQVYTDSGNIPWSEKGYNHDGSNHEQVQLVMIWGVDTHLPGFLKVLPGTASSARNLMSAVAESRLKNVIILADKAFFSMPNVRDLEGYGVHYALALRRDLDKLEFPPLSSYTKYFMYNKSVQWWKEYERDGRRVVQYLDKEIAAREEATFLASVEERKATMEDYQHKRRTFGTLTIMTDTGLSPKELYELYKQRKDIEDAFDALKNTLEADRTWMQSRESLQGYYFVLFLALHLYSQALLHLHTKKLLEKYSVHDVLWWLTKAYITVVDGKPIPGEVLKSTRDLVEELEIPITERLGS